MTDISASQLALYSPQSGDTDMRVSQLGLYALTVEPAAGVIVSQLAVYSASIEYQIPTFYTGFRIPALWGTGLYVER